MRLIDAQAYCKELISERDYPNRSKEFIAAMEVAIADLGDMPTVDAVEVVHGRWEDYREGVAWGFPYLCSNCHKAHDYKERHCPNCGAKMDGENESES